MANSKVKVNSIEGYDPAGPVVLGYGASVSIVTGDGDVNVTGIITATSFVGSGENLTGLSIATKSRSIAYNFIT